MLMLEAAALSVTMIIWTLWGWSIAYAGSDIGGIFGDPASGFLLKDSMVAQDGVFTATGLNGNNYPVSVDVAFQVAFAMITVGLICGAIAERVKYSTWMISWRCGSPSTTLLWPTWSGTVVCCLLTAHLQGHRRCRPRFRRWYGRPHQRRSRRPDHRAHHRQA